VAGQVLGKVLGTVNPTSAAATGNTGNGTMSAVTAVAPAIGGTYQVIYISATKFEVYDPNGDLVGEGVNGTPFNAGGLGFTMTAGGTAFAAGDAYTISVPVADQATVVYSIDAFGNNGDGQLALATPAALNGAQIGRYIAICATQTVPAGAEGTFTVTDPQGNVVGTATIGTPFASQVAFTITDGDVPFDVGDVFYIDVTEAPIPNQYKALNPAAADGSQIAAAIAYQGFATTSSAEPIAGIVRQAELIGNSLTWPAGMTAAQRAAALDQLAKLTLIVRPSTLATAGGMA
jgi:hypothetical protein